MSGMCGKCAAIGSNQAGPAAHSPSCPNQGGSSLFMEDSLVLALGRAIKAEEAAEKRFDALPSPLKTGLSNTGWKRWDAAQTALHKARNVRFAAEHDLETHRKKREPGFEAHYAFQDADDAWSRELQRLFGKRAGDVRYTDAGKGAPGSVLRSLHDAREALRMAWEADKRRKGR